MVAKPKKPIKTEMRDLFTANPIGPLMLNQFTLASYCKLFCMAFNTHQKDSPT